MISSLRSDKDSLLPSTTQPLFFNNIEESHGKHVKELFREINHIYRDLAKASSKRRFLLRCRSNDLTPPHITNICKRHNNISFFSKFGKRSFSEYNQFFSKKTLKIEIRDIHFHIQYLHKSLSNIEDKIIETNMDSSTLANFFYLSCKKYYSTLQKMNRIHKNKFQFLHSKHQANLNKYPKKPDNWIKNLTDLEIPNEVIDVVSLGSNFSIKSKFDKKDALYTIKNTECVLQKSNLHQDEKKEIRERITKHMSQTLKRQTHTTVDNRHMSRKLKITKNFLKDNPDILFTNSDKGNVTVCMKKCDYNEKMIELLSDTSTYITIKKNPIEKLQKNTSEILKSLNDNGYLKYKYHNNQLTVTDTTLAKGYGLPKIHKNNVPLRPIISLVNSPTHFLAKIIYNEIKTAIKTPKSHIDNSFELKTKLSSVKIDRDYVLLSLDVTSLFTNVPCDLVIRSLERRIESIRRKCKIPFEDIIKCTEFLFDNTFFTFNGQVYKQIFGTPMGSPISPLFADIVMDDLETDCLSNLKEKYGCEPTFYVRYVDDTCMCVRRDFVEVVINEFNSWNEHLKFTFEIEENSRINFLDITLIRRNKDIITDWYQKPSASGRLINYLSNHPIQQKRNIIYNLTDRAILLSHEKFHLKNCEKVKSLLLKNDYPIEFIENNIKKRLKSIRAKNVNSASNANNDVTYSVTCLPYKSNFHLLSSIFKKFNITTIPIVEKSLNSIIKLGKDVTKKWEQTNVVYEFSCKNCPASYVGETKRTLKKRIDEHRKHRNQNSVVSLHEIDGHCFDWDNTKILDSERNYNKRLISEMIHIKSNFNNINRKEDIFSLSSVYFPLIRTFK